MQISGQPKGIDYRLIAEEYGYQPVPDGFFLPERENLHIDWDENLLPRRTEELLMMNHYHQHENECSPAALLRRRPMRCDRQNLALETWKIFDVAHQTHHLSFELRFLDKLKYDAIAEFTLRHNGNVWELHHRLVEEKYRGQQIAGKMLQSIEHCIQLSANIKKADQRITLSVRQLPVLNFFLTHGYQIVEKDQERFGIFMSELEAGDPKYVVASCEDDFLAKKRSPRMWYVFEREKYEKIGTRIWERDFIDGMNSPYLKNAVSFELEKVFKAESVVDFVRKDVKKRVKRV